VQGATVTSAPDAELLTLSGLPSAARVTVAVNPS
jgi:hypothetical protein